MRSNRALTAIGIGVLLGATFVAGMVTALALFDVYGFRAKTEIDLVELLKVVVFAAAAFLAKKYFDVRERASKAQEQTILSVAADAHTTARTCQQLFRKCVADDTVTESARSELVGFLAQLENEVVAVDELLRRSGHAVTSELADAFDEFAELLTNEGLVAPRLSLPAAEASLRRVRVALHSVALSIARKF
jgi:hypothetical protein